MQKANLEKWVDELQAQIDAVKRDIARIPAPEPPAPEPECSVFACGSATLTVTDYPYDESDDSAFLRVAEYEFDETFDTENYDYYISFDYYSIDALTALTYYATTNCVILHDGAPLRGDVMPVLSSELTRGTHTYAVAGVVSVQFQYGESGVTMNISSNSNDGSCITDGTNGVTTIDYMIAAKKKAEPSTKKRKTKNRRK